jgi:23S rRNA pseudouridine2605 synthase
MMGDMDMQRKAAPDPAPADDVMRLQRYLALAGVASRRSAEDLIRARRVSVNGKTAKLGSSVKSGDDIRVNGERVWLAEERTLYIAHKPVGMMTTLSDPEGRPTIVSLMPRGVRLHPIGRLDFDTAGLLVLTNDGALTQRLSHPSFGVDKTYRVRVRGRLESTTLDLLQAGVRLEDGVTQPARVRVVARNREATTFDITIHEGRNRQVRRMLEELGHPVTDLMRIAFGPFRLGNLAPGAIRQPTPPERAALKRIIDEHDEQGLDA